MKANEEYRLSCEKSDIVQMPNGVIGIITRDEITCGGNVRYVEVFPFTNWFFHFCLFFSGWTTFSDDQINTLTPLHLAPRT